MKLLTQVVCWLLPFIAPNLSHAAETYQAPFWLPGGNLQTIWAALLSRPSVEYRRERWELPDGDFLDLDWVDGPANAPLVVLFHGLEGNSRSHYALQLMAEVRQRGWRGVVPHFRGCSGEPNRLPRSYHAGDTREIGYILNRLRAAESAPMRCVGVSLGGNALLRWLEIKGEEALPVVNRAVAISAPLDLPLAGATLDQGFARFYTARFLKTLKAKALAKLDHYPQLYDRQAVANANSIYVFDNLVTAPVHGYRDTDDYWHRAASKPDLSLIRVPTLLINAYNDPFMPGETLQTREEVSDRVTLEFPKTGGHVGFISGPFPGNFSWLRHRTMGFFTKSSSSAN